MIGFFPDPYPDELLYSACARFGDRSGYANVADVARELFGKQIANISFPNRLAHLISVLPAGHTYTVDKLIDDNTLLRFYSPFISDQRARVIRKEMAGQQENRIHSRLGINAGRLRVPSKLRFCPDCVSADRNAYREAYWHRVHQLPGIEVCPDHAVFLELSSAGWRERASIAVFLSAELSIDDRKPRRINTNDQYEELFLAIAREAQWLLNWRGVPPTKSALRNRYWNQLLRIGFAYYNGRIKHTELLKEFTRFYSPSLLQRLQSDIGDRNQT
ncbi:MAG TPA: TnsD family Tn7-like transposition protein, partial [Pyrinomonadaceae bacterium]